MPLTDGPCQPDDERLKLIWLLLRCFILDALHDFSGGEYNITTAGIWATYPQDFLSVGNGLADQVIIVIIIIRSISLKAYFSGSILLINKVESAIFNSSLNLNFDYTVQPN